MPDINMGLVATIFNNTDIEHFCYFMKFYWADLNLLIITPEPMVFVLFII